MEGEIERDREIYTKGEIQRREWEKGERKGGRDWDREGKQGKSILVLLLLCMTYTSSNSVRRKKNTHTHTLQINTSNFNTQSFW